MAVKLYLKLDGKYLSGVDTWVGRAGARDFIDERLNNNHLLLVLTKYPTARIVCMRTRSRDDVWNAAIEKAASLVGKGLARRGFDLAFSNEVRALKR